jgi:hypothetical protein
MEMIETKALAPQSAATLWRFSPLSLIDLCPDPTIVSGEPIREMLV